MSAIHIQRLTHRARIRGEAAPVVRTRIERTMAEMLETGFESALLYAGVDTDEEICIRRFATRARLDPRNSDAQWVMDWSAAWIDALRGVLQSGGENVIRYRSRTHVLVEMAVHILRGDTSHAWAWRQLGHWSGTPPDSPQARVELAQVLSRHPTAVLPVCGVLAAGRTLGAWVAQLPAVALRALSKAALRSADVDDELPDRRHVIGTATTAAAPPERVSRILLASPLRAELLPVATADNAVDLAALMLLSAEPAAPRHDATGLLVGIGRELIEKNRCRAEPTGAERAESGAPVRKPDARARIALPPRVEEAPPPAVPAHAQSTAAETNKRTFERRPLPVDAPRIAEHEPGTTEPDNTVALAPRTARTGFGGLMYLLWLIEPCGVLDALRDGNPLARRGLRWTLRHMALQWLPLAADDPVLMAFTGLAPLEAGGSPERDEDPPTPAEAEEIARFAQRLVALLREKLSEPAIAREHLLDTVCRRVAAIRFEPGWIELHFELASASTAIRRCGLDRDLGWVPWLGTVVQFTYV
jgi:hypothetical protein